MEQVVNKKVTLDLQKVDGNAFSILAAFRKQAKKEGWTKEEIDTVIEEAMTSDYVHLVSTIDEHIQMP